MAKFKHAILYRVGEAGVMVTGDITGPYSDMAMALTDLGSKGFGVVTALDKSSAGFPNAAGNHVLICRKDATDDEE